MSKIKKNIKSLKGFTLLELIVVIAIISVLLMIIVPNMTDYIRTSRIREANDRAQQIYVATQDYLNSLQARGAKVTDYFGAADGNVCKIGLDLNTQRIANIKNTSYVQPNSGDPGYDDSPNNSLRLMSSGMVGQSSFNVTTLTADYKWKEAVKGILGGLSEDFEGAFYVEIYPVTYTVRLALYSSQNKDCTTGTFKSDERFDWDAVCAVSMKPYESMFTVATNDTLADVQVHGRTMHIAKSQETCYNKGYETAYVGQYPIPAPTA